MTFADALNKISRKRLMAAIGDPTHVGDLIPAESWILRSSCRMTGEIKLAYDEITTWSRKYGKDRAEAGPTRRVEPRDRRPKDFAMPSGSWYIHGRTRLRYTKSRNHMKAVATPCRTVAAVDPWARGWDDGRRWQNTDAMPQSDDLSRPALSPLARQLAGGARSNRRVDGAFRGG